MTDNAPSAMNAALSNPKQDMADLDRLERRRFALRYALDEIATLGPSIDPPKATEERAEASAVLDEEATRLLNDKAYLCSVYTEGAQKASVIARKTLRKVYKKVGLVEKPF